MNFTTKPLVIIDDTNVDTNVDTANPLSLTPPLTPPLTTTEIPRGIVCICIESQETKEQEIVPGLMIDEKTVVYIATYQPSFPYGQADISRYYEYRLSKPTNDGGRRCPFCQGVTYHGSYGIRKCDMCSVNYIVDANSRKVEEKK